MSEYVVRWKHLRHGPGFDGQVEAVKLHRLTPTWMTRLEKRLQKWNDWRTARAWNKMCVSYSQYGGKTICYIYQPNSSETNDLMLIAHAESICSWRDQFDRRVGRLYSLAMALHEWDSCATSALIKTQILTDNIPQAGEQGNAFYLAFLAHDQVAVKRICAEIVQSWKQR